MQDLPGLKSKPSQLAFLQYTSGSTSQPKGVMLSHQNLIANIGAFASALGGTSEDVAVSWLPLFHDMGLIGMLMGSLYVRASLYLMPPELFIRSPEIWLRTLSKYGGTVTAAPNFAFHYCVKRVSAERARELNLDRVRVMLNGAEPVDVEAVENFTRHFSPSGLKSNVILPVYGLAESSLAVTFPQIGQLMTDEVDAELLETQGVAKSPGSKSRKKTLVSVGKPIATQEIRIVNDCGTTLGERRVGEILVKGPSVMKGYYGKKKESGQALNEGWLKTGDYGYLSEGNLFITGRKKDLIIRRGRNYFPQDIEEVVNGVKGIRKGRVVAFGTAKDGSDTEIIIVAETRVKEKPELDKIVVSVKQSISKSFPFSPLDVQLVPPGTIPRTSSGKIRRQPCKDLYLAGTLLKKSQSGFFASRKWFIQALLGNARHMAGRAMFWR